MVGTTKLGEARYRPTYINIYYAWIIKHGRGACLACVSVGHYRRAMCHFMFWCSPSEHDNEMCMTACIIIFPDTLRRFLF
jgi:hypothetical protein